MSTKTLFLISSSLLVISFLAIKMPVTQVAALNATAIDRMQQKASTAAEKQTTELAKIKGRADTMIQNRLDSLNKLLTRVQNDKRLTADEKTSLTADINTTIANLTTLKSKIDADTDVTTARADTKSIVTSYRIYLFYEPKTRLLVVIDNLQTDIDSITTLTGKIQTLITTLKGQGKDTTIAQSALSDANAQLALASTLLTTDKTLITNVTISTTNPQSIFTQVRQDLTTVRADFAKIRTDFATIRSNLHSLKPTPTP